MAARAIASGTISFGLVSIPVKLFTAASSEQVRFNMLHKDCGSRLKQQMICPVHNEVVPRNEVTKGYEYTRGQFVTFTDEELKALEMERSSSLDIVEFVPLSTVDLVQVEKSYYLGPDKGGDKAYQLLRQAMHNTGRVAVGRWAARGKEQLILIRPYQDGLLLHQMYYANEVRAFDEVDTGAKQTFKAVESDLAEKLIGELSSAAFEPEKYHDQYEDRVRASVEQKVAGQQITAVPEQPKAQIIDLFEALKKSLSEAQSKPSAQKSDDEGVELKPRPPKKAVLRKMGEKRKASSGSKE
jgi:DNA end-binding protein Ku